MPPAPTQSQRSRQLRRASSRQLELVKIIILCFALPLLTCGLVQSFNFSEQQNPVVSFLHEWHAKISCLWLFSPYFDFSFNTKILTEKSNIEPDLVYSYLLLSCCTNDGCFVWGTVYFWDTHMTYCLSPKVSPNLPPSAGLQSACVDMKEFGLWLGHAVGSVDLAFKTALLKLC